MAAMPRPEPTPYATGPTVHYVPVPPNVVVNPIRPRLSREHRPSSGRAKDFHPPDQNQNAAHHIHATLRLPRLRQAAFRRPQPAISTLRPRLVPRDGRRTIAGLGRSRPSPRPERAMMGPWDRSRDWEARSVTVHAPRPRTDQGAEQIQSLQVRFCSCFRVAAVSAAGPRRADLRRGHEDENPATRSPNLGEVILVRGPSTVPRNSQGSLTCPVRRTTAQFTRTLG